MGISMSKWVQSAHRPVCRRAAHRGSQVTADVGGAEEQDLGLNVLHCLGDDLGISVGGVVLQQGLLYTYTLSAVVAQLGAMASTLSPSRMPAEFTPQLVSQSSRPSEISSKSSGHHLALALLTENPYVFEGADVGTIKKPFSYSFF